MPQLPFEKKKGGKKDNNNKLKKNAQSRETDRKKKLFGFEKKMKRLWNLSLVFLFKLAGCTWLSNDIPETPHLTKVQIYK
jgi:hypothetical protein